MKIVSVFHSLSDAGGLCIKQTYIVGICIHIVMCV